MHFILIKEKRLKSVVLLNDGISAVKDHIPKQKKGIKSIKTRLVQPSGFGSALVMISFFLAITGTCSLKRPKNPNQNKCENLFSRVCFQKKQDQLL